ncbi:hypothetical protein LAZ67_X001482, partial [Cordylochernes scorpioides]
MLGNETVTRRSRRLQGLQPELSTVLAFPARKKMEREENRPFCHRWRDPTVFSGERGEDSQRWLSDFQRVARYNKWDDSMCLANVIFYLTGTAKCWFENFEEILNSWEEFKIKFCEIFGNKEDTARKAENILRTRAQTSGENVESYIQEVLLLCKQSNPRMSEGEKVSHLIKGVAEEVYQALVGKDISTVDQFVAFCRRFEAFKRMRVAPPRFNRLPNVTTISTAEPENLEALIRRIVREEVQKFMAPPSTFAAQDIDTPSPDLRDVIRSEIQQTLAPISAPRQPESFRPRRQYLPQNDQGYRRRTEGPPNNQRTQWRTEDDRPICFHCGRPGHVARYCRDRRQAFADARLGRETVDFGRPRTENYTMGESGSELSQGRFRNPSPYPHRGRFQAPRRTSQSPARRPSRSPSRRTATMEKNWISVNIQGRNVQALVDSGADYSVISEAFRRSIKAPVFKENGPLLRAADKKPIVTLGKCYLEVQIKGLDIIFDFVVAAECSHDVILGWDFFKATDAIIDCGENKLYLSEAEKSYEWKDLKLCAAMDCVIPPKSFGKIVVTSQDVFGSRDVVVTGSKRLQLEKGLFIPSSLVRFLHGRAVLWVTNSTHQSQVIPSDMKIGTMQDLEVGSISNLDACSEIAGKDEVTSPDVRECLKDPSGRLARWALKLQEYDINIVYKSGRKHKDADCLSRSPLADTAEIEGHITSIQDIAEEQSKDPHLVGIREKLANENLKGYQMIGGVLYKKNYDPEGKPWLLVVPKQMRHEILKDVHDTPMAGHLGFAKTYDRVRKRFYWPGLYRTVSQYIAHCKECQRRKGVPQKPPGLLVPIPPTTSPFQKIGIDYLGRFPISHTGNRWIIVATDYLTRFAITKAAATAEATELATFLIEDVILKHGAPREIITDRGRNFMSQTIREINNLNGTIHRFTTAYHPQTNGLTERLNKTLTDMISMYVDVDQKNWDNILPYVTFAYNTARQETTGYSPFFLVHGREVETPLDSILPYQPAGTAEDYVGHLVTNAEDARMLARLNILQAQSKDKERYDKKHQEVTYKEGDLVWVFTPVRTVGLSEKLLKRYFGPYRVIRKISSVNYQVEGVTNTRRRRKTQDIVHVVRMKPYHDPEVQEQIAQELVNLNVLCQSVLLAKDEATDEEVDGEFQECEKYIWERFIMERRVRALREQGKDVLSTGGGNRDADLKNKGDLQKFKGNPGDWLSRWGQFDKINANGKYEDVDLKNKEDSEAKPKGEGVKDSEAKPKGAGVKDSEAKPKGEGVKESEAKPKDEGMKDSEDQPKGDGVKDSDKVNSKDGVKDSDKVNSKDGDEVKESEGQNAGDEGEGKKDSEAELKGGVEDSEAAVKCNEVKDSETAVDSFVGVKEAEAKVQASRKLVEARPTGDTESKIKGNYRETEAQDLKTINKSDYAENKDDKCNKRKDHDGNETKNINEEQGTDSKVAEEKLDVEQDAARNEISETYPNTLRRMVNRTIRNDKGEPKCFNCNQFGHIARDCPAPRTTLTCRGCGQTGHKERNCTRPKEGLKVANLEVEGLETVPPDVYLKDVKIDNKETVKAMIDTGSSSCLMRESVARRISVDIEPDSTSLYGIGNQTAPAARTVGKTTVDLEIDGIVGREITVFIVKDDAQPYDLLIGKTWTDLPYVSFARIGKNLHIGYSSEFPFANLQEGIKSRRIELRATETVQLESDSINFTSAITDEVKDGYVLFTGVDDACVDSLLEVVDGKTTVPIISAGKGKLRRIRFRLKNEEKREGQDQMKRKRPILPEDINVNHSLTSKERQEILDVVNEYRDCFALGMEELGCTDVTKMDIKEVDGSKPVCLRPYKTTASEREAIREIVREWKDNGIVTETRSPYASPVLLVRKKTGDHRLVVDYRRLNTQTVKDKFPLPRIDDLLEGLRNAKFFTTLDLAHGYLQIPLTDKAKLKTAFITPDDTGQFERMIFGLANAPAEFQRLMHTVLGPLLNKKAFCYLDDVIIPAKDWREMIERLREVLERIRSAKLTLKPSKCEFGRREVEFLGTTKGSGRISVLAHYNPELKTEVHCDASAEGLAGMVLQMDEDGKWCLVYCVSKKTTEAEKMYHSSKLELMAIVWTLDRLRQFLVGIKFTVVTDCQALVYMNAKKTTNPQIARWYNLIQEYDFEIRHKPGEKIAHVDGMSRAPVDDPRDTMEEIVEKNLEVCFAITLEEQILMIQHSDPELRDLIQIFRKEPCDRTVGEQNRINDYSYKGGRLFRMVENGEEERALYVIPKSMRKSLVVKFHDLMGHFATDRTVNKIKEFYWFPSMKRYVRHHVGMCLECLFNKVPGGKQQGFLHPIKSGKRPFSIVHMDHVGPFVRSTKATSIEDPRRKDWDLKIKEVERDLNNAVNKTTNKTPFETLHGYSPRFHDGILRRLADEDVDPWTEPDRIQESVRTQIENKQEIMKTYYDKKKCRTIQFEVGEIVVMRHVPKMTGEPTKAQPKYRGPLIITEVLPSDTYRVTQLSERTSGRFYTTTAHISQLKSRHSEEDDSATEESPDEEPEVEDTPRRNPRRSCNARFNRGRLKSGMAECRRHPDQRATDKQIINAQNIESELPSRRNTRKTTGRGGLAFWTTSSWQHGTAHGSGCHGDDLNHNIEV